MADPHCIGIWRKSKLIPDATGQEENDGRILVAVDAGGSLIGTHEITGASLQGTTCDGATISFTRITARETVSYWGEINSEDPLIDRIKGRFERQTLTFDLAFNAETLPDSGDWTAEKPT